MINEKCPTCRGVLTIKKGRYGPFVSCVNFPKCKFSRDLNKEEAQKLIEEIEDEEPEEDKQTELALQMYFAMT